MVGQGALRECLRDPEVEQVVSIVRSSTGTTQEKLREIVHKTFLDFTPVENELTGLNACLYCLGVTSTGATEENYTRITHEFTIAGATTLLKLNPGMTFVFVSGTGADSTERGTTMRARITESGTAAAPQEPAATPVATSTKRVIVVSAFTTVKEVAWPYDMKGLQRQTVAEMTAKAGAEYDVMAEDPATPQGHVYTLGGKVVSWHVE